MYFLTFLVPLLLLPLTSALPADPTNTSVASTASASKVPPRCVVNLPLFDSLPKPFTLSTYRPSRPQQNGRPFSITAKSLTVDGPAAQLRLRNGSLRERNAGTAFLARRQRGKNYRLVRFKDERGGGGDRLQVSGAYVCVRNVRRTEVSPVGQTWCVVGKRVGVKQKGSGGECVEVRALIV